jgi:hypothetical protein
MYCNGLADLNNPSVAHYLIDQLERHLRENNGKRSRAMETVICGQLPAGVSPSHEWGRPVESRIYDPITLGQCELSWHSGIPILLGG